MKKNFSKTIMIIVAVLLTLVLISTSTVSGIFAKYVVTKDATTIVSLKKFGVKLAMNKGANFVESGANATPTIADDGSSTSVTISNISLIPGSDYKDIIKFTASIDGTTSVATRLKVKVKINTSDAEFAKFAVGDTTYMPIGFYATKNGGTATEIAAPWNFNSKATLEDGIMNGLYSLIGDEVVGDDWAEVKIANANASNFINNTVLYSISFGFEFPITYGTGNAVADYDEIMTKIAENGATISITYTVSLEQA